MQQHPIPQNITAYEFHLIGNMTLKQFVELGVGIGAGVFFYSLGLPGYITWFLIIASVLIASALAFMPFDGRPLDKMVIEFIKAVYAPTQYIWRKDAVIPEYFTHKAKKLYQPDELTLERQRMRKNIGEFLSTLPGDGTSPASATEQQEAAYLNSLNTLFDQVQPTTPVIEGAQEIAFHNTPKVRVRKMKMAEDLSVQPTAEHYADKTATISIPEETIPQQATAQEIPTAPAEQVANVSQPESSTGPQAIYSETTMQATTNKQLPFPNQPDKPNILVGMVLDSNGKIIENAIIEIRDEKHMPVRALKTNSLGQFFAASQLKNGIYEIEVEKQGFTFDTVSIELKNKIIPPLEIRSKN